MRNYRNKKVRDRIYGAGAGSGACAFPGKHSLRLEWSFQHAVATKGEKREYYGKFTQAAWKQLTNLMGLVPPGMRATCRWKLMDRRNIVCSGNWSGAPNLGPFTARYLWYGDDQIAITPQYGNLFPVRAGRYWIYNTRELTDAEQLRLSGYIARNIAELRTP